MEPATRYLCIWQAPGLLGGPQRAHSSVYYDTAAEALAGHDVPPGPGFRLLGTLCLRGSDQPRFVGTLRLQEWASAEKGEPWRAA